ncbi:hypothetical protein Syun_013848 [Stephania yunnanensis]|uniref:Uncharacterized protein n=1 Tax=Stephania yunnanensis TaxID=152371 RepID=A0AAP0JI44_9MAGN
MTPFHHSGLQCPLSLADNHVDRAAMEPLKNFLPPREERVVRRLPPTQDLVKLNTDGSFVSTHNWASAGGLRREGNRVADALVNRARDSR